MKNRVCLTSFGAALVFGAAIAGPAPAQDGAALLEGKAAFTDWRADRPGLRRHIRPADLPPANMAASSANGVRVATRTTLPWRFTVASIVFALSRFSEIMLCPGSPAIG